MVGKMKGFAPYTIMPKPPAINLDQIIEKVSLEAAKVSQEILYDAEDYIAIANIIIFLYSVEKTFGNLKTVQKGYQKLLENYNDAAEEVDEMGLREAYNRLHEKYGIELLFNDFDINNILDEKATSEQLKIRLTTGYNSQK